MKIFFEKLHIYIFKEISINKQRKYFLKNYFFRDQSSRASHDPAHCFGNHRIVRYSADMSVGCFGECGFGSSGSAGDSPKRLTHPKVHCKFYPPIQTFLREKDPEKW